MFESKITAGPLTITMADGFPPELDTLAARNLSGHGFLRAAWYRAGEMGRGASGNASGGKTLVVQRTHGAVIAAIPTVPFGPAIGRARKVPGAYWPLRGALISPDCNMLELAQALECRVARSLGPVWRLGPARMDDAATLMMIDAAQLAGWRVLSRAAGTAWRIDLDDARAKGWPKVSSAKRVRRIERRLEGLGQIEWRYVRGRAWDDNVLAQLGAVEAASWIKTATDGSGAKFMTPQQRDLWRQALSDPVLAEMLCATILLINGRAVAFTFDCDDGPVQYGIAGSYVSELAKYEIGKLTNYRAVIDAIADGQQLMDLGTGDSGYKREMGATEGYLLADLLFVRNHTAARLLASVWGHEIGSSTRHG